MNRRRVIAILALGALLAVGAVVVVSHRGAGDGVVSAQHVLQREARFSSGPTAGSAFADVSNILLRDATSCARRHSAGDQRCAARFSAAAYASVTAFALVTCTQPGVYQARRDAMAQLDGILTVDRAHGRLRAPRVPNVPRCR